MGTDDSPPLERVEQPSFDRTYLDTASELAPEAADPPYEEQRDAFESNFEEFSEKWEPYLVDHVPTPDIERPTKSLTQFQFRYETSDDERSFNRVHAGEGTWESTRIPDYRGPVGEWTGFYRTEFDYEDPPEQNRVILEFDAVDYIGTIYLNGRCLTRHEGFFAPFEVDVTDQIQTTGNVLVVEVENQIPTDQGTPGLGELDGDKLYADAGMGFDDPEIGWHMNTAGAGLRGDVTLEERSPVHVKCAFVRPNPSSDTAEAWIEVDNTTGERRDIRLDLMVYPKNFHEESIDGGSHEPATANLGLNYYRIPVDMPEHRRWHPESPWLYALRISLADPATDAPVDSLDTQFGMRSFEMEEEAEPKGRLYLNDEPVSLRGANCSANLGRAAFDGDEEQIVKDLLIAKYANANFLRLTQRPLPEIVYEYCDKLGILTQTDLPLSGGLRRNQMVEGIKQATEMERLIRGHPSAVMISYINEPQSTEDRDLSHRRLDRDEFATFVEAATDAVHVQNPDRVVKSASGATYPLSSSLPPVHGLPDFHTYTMWYYSTHMGSLHKGELPTILKQGWKTGCGEYGAEALDSLELMRQEYPDDWLPDALDEEWDPDDIPQCQTYGQHVLWYDEPDTITDWIEASQIHQARMTTMMTDALRRSDRVVLIAIYYLIDAWPAGWMKALVDANRTPKRGYFALKRALKPRRINLRTDRNSFFVGETAEVETWLLNDPPEPMEGAEIRATVRTRDDDHATFRSEAIGIEGTTSSYVGTVRFEVPDVDDRGTVYVDAALYDEEGTLVDGERLTLEAFERLDEERTASYLGEEPAGFASVADLMPYEPGKSFDVLLVTVPSEYEDHREAVLEEVADGARVVFLRTGGDVTWNIGDTTVRTRQYDGAVGELPEPHALELDNSLPFVARNPRDPRTVEFDPDDFGYWYDANTDRINRIANSVVDHELTPLLYTWETESTEAEKPSDVSTEKTQVPVVGALDYGDGELIFSELVTDGRVGYEPILARFLANLL